MINLKKVIKLIVDIITCILIALVALYLVLAFYNKYINKDGKFLIGKYYIFQIATGSMEPEYNIGDLSFTLLNATIKERTGKKFDKNKDFALALGMGEITINRLENGSTQSGAVDSIIRLSENPENMLELIERNR